MNAPLALSAFAPTPPRESHLGATVRADSPAWALWGSILLVGLTFFLTAHDPHVSVAVSYTQNAEEMELAAEGGNALRRLAFFSFAGWGIVLLATSRKGFCPAPLLALSLGLLLGWTVMSVVWADDPGMCVRRLAVLICALTAALGMARAFTLPQLAWLAVVVLASLAAIGVLTEVSLGTFQPWANDYRFAGTVHPNTQGPALATLALAAFGLAREASRRRGVLVAVFVIALGLLVLTKSRTTTAAFLAAIGAVLLVQLPWRTKLFGAVAGCWLAAATLWLFWVAGVDPLTDFREALLLGRAEESDTLSGRAFIWPELLTFVEQRPWIGHGYEAFWTPARIETISGALGWGLREAHNAYLELLLWLGLVGLVLALAVVAAALAGLVRKSQGKQRAAYTLPLGLLVFALINAALESGMVVVHLVPFLLGTSLLRVALFDSEDPGDLNKCQEPHA